LDRAIQIAAEVTYVALKLAKVAARAVPVVAAAVIYEEGTTLVAPRVMENRMVGPYRSGNSASHAWAMTREAQEYFDRIGAKNNQDSSQTPSQGTGNGGSTGNSNGNAAPNDPDDEPRTGPYDTGEVKTLRARSRTKDGLQIDHQPSSASLKAAREKQLGRKLTPQEAKDIDSQAAGVALPDKVHAAQPTTGGRNTQDQINRDKDNLKAAQARDSAAMIQNSSQGDKERAAHAAEHVRQQNEDR